MREREQVDAINLPEERELWLNLGVEALRNIGNDPEGDRDILLTDLIRGNGMLVPIDDIQGNIFNPSTSLGDDQLRLRARRVMAISATDRAELENLRNNGEWPESWGPEPEARDWIDEDVERDAPGGKAMEIAQAYADEYLNNSGDFPEGRAHVLAEFHSNRRRWIMELPDERLAEALDDRILERNGFISAIVAA